MCTSIAWLMHAGREENLLVLVLDASVWSRLWLYQLRPQEFAVNNWILSCHHQSKQSLFLVLFLCLCVWFISLHRIQGLPAPAPASPSTKSEKKCIPCCWSVGLTCGPSEENDVIPTHPVLQEVEPFTWYGLLKTFLHVYLLSMLSRMKLIDSMHSLHFTFGSLQFPFTYLTLLFRLIPFPTTLLEFYLM